MGLRTAARTAAAAMTDTDLIAALDQVARLADRPSADTSVIKAGALVEQLLDRYEARTAVCRDHQSRTHELPDGYAWCVAGRHELDLHAA